MGNKCLVINTLSTKNMGIVQVNTRMWSDQSFMLYFCSQTICATYNICMVSLDVLHVFYKSITHIWL